MMPPPPVDPTAPTTSPNTKASAPVLGRDDLRWCAALAVLPVIAVVLAGGRAFGPVSVDLAWALTRLWGAAHGAGLHTQWLDAPEGTNLLTMAGGWTDIWVGGALARVTGPMVAYNLVAALYLWAAGVGGYALARVAGVRRAWLAGLLLQLDPALLAHLHGGRIEHGPIGVAALAVAATILAWNGRRGAVLLAGLAGAATVVSGWEVAFTLGLCAPFGVAAALACPPADGRTAGVGRGAAAAGLAALLASPLVWAYLHAPSAAAPGFGRWLAVHQAIGVLPAWGDPRPALPVLAAIPVWAARQSRGVFLAILAGATVLYLLAIGPSPGWHAATSPPLAWWASQDGLDAAVAPWAPFTQLMSWVGRYHWPARLLAPLGVVGAVAVAGLADRRPAWMAAIVWTVLVDVPVLPRGRAAMPASPALAAIARRPGAVLDLPIWQNPALHLDDQLHQLAHHQPIARSLQLFHLDPTLRPRIDADPVLRWFLALTGEAAPPPARFARDAFAPHRARGFGWVTLRRGPLPDDRWAMAVDAIGLGEPDLAEGDGWRAWRLR
jgi:hypothetical protein